MRLIKERLRNCYESVKGKSCYGCVKAGLGPHKYIYGAGELESELEKRAGKLQNASWKRRAVKCYTNSRKKKEVL